MAPAITDSKDLEFLMTCLSEAGDLSINWEGVKTKTGYSRADTGQTKFRKLVESTGKYRLVKGKVVAIPAQTARSASTYVLTPQISSKKRKAPTKDDDEDEPSGKRLSSKGKRQSASNKTKTEDQDGEDTRSQDGDNNGGADVEQTA